MGTTPPRPLSDSADLNHRQAAPTAQGMNSAPSAALATDSDLLDAYSEAVTGRCARRRRPWCTWT